MHKVTFEPTPNPNTYRFSLPQTGLTSPKILKNAREAESSPLAKKIFGFPWTSEILLSSDFIAVTKQDWVEWDILANPLSGLIQEHVDNEEFFWIEFSSSEPLSDDIDPQDSPLIKDIKYTLLNEIRPVVALDGGDIRFVKLENDILYVSMQGACSGCPSSQATLKQGIEVRIQELYPQIKSVEAIA